MMNKHLIDMSRYYVSRRTKIASLSGSKEILTNYCKYTSRYGLDSLGYGKGLNFPGRITDETFTKAMELVDDDTDETNDPRLFIYSTAGKNVWAFHRYNAVADPEFEESMLITISAATVGALNVVISANKQNLTSCIKRDVMMKAVFNNAKDKSMPYIRCMMEIYPNFNDATEEYNIYIEALNVITTAVVKHIMDLEDSLR